MVSLELDTLIMCTMPVDLSRTCALYTGGLYGCSADVPACGVLCCSDIAFVACLVTIITMPLPVCRQAQHTRRKPDRQSKKKNGVLEHV